MKVGKVVQRGIAMRAWPGRRERYKERCRASLSGARLNPLGAYLSEDLKGVRCG